MRVEGIKAYVCGKPSIIMESKNTMNDTNVVGNTKIINESTKPLLPVEDVCCGITYDPNENDKTCWDQCEPVPYVLCLCCFVDLGYYCYRRNIRG